MNLFNFKIAKALNLHADEVVINIVGSSYGEILGMAETPKGVYDFTYDSANKSFSYLELAV